MEIGLTYTHTRNHNIYITELDGDGQVFRMVWPAWWRHDSPPPYIYGVEFANLPKNWTVV